MSEVVKMYENIGIEKDRCYGCTRACTDCKPDYPPFTEKKQLELTKWLSKRCFYIEISEMMDKSYGIAFKYQPADEYKNEQSECCVNKNFTEALAESINYIWQDLTEEEQEALRGILRA